MTPLTLTIGLWGHMVYSITQKLYRAYIEDKDRPHEWVGWALMLSMFAVTYFWVTAIWLITEGVIEWIF